MFCIGWLHFAPYYASVWYSIEVLVLCELARIGLVLYVFGS